jgi:ATP-dependent NAD(P)H-hydrate dehydratase
VAQILKEAQERSIYLVLDADALFLLSLPEYRSILRGYDKVVLTPNVVEYKRLVDSKSEIDKATIVEKGARDTITRNDTTLVCTEEGGLKRSGGIGDVLSGTLGTLVAWHAILKEQGKVEDEDLSLACWTACCFVKRATKRAFQAKKRAMTAPDVLNELGPAIDEMTS